MIDSRATREWTYEDLYQVCVDEGYSEARKAVANVGHVYGNPKQLARAHDVATLQGWRVACDTTRFAGSARGEAWNDAWRRLLQAPLKEAIMLRWANPRGLYKQDGWICVQRVLGHVCHGESTRHECWPPHTATPSLWSRWRDRKPAVFVSQPYNWTESMERDTQEFCEEQGLRLTVTPPGRGWRPLGEAWLITYEAAVKPQARPTYKKWPHQPGVYGIQNLQDGGRWYVGSAQDLSQRRASHLSHLRWGDHHSSELQAAYQAHGEAALTFSILERFYEVDTASLREREDYWMRQLGGLTDGYNTNAAIQASEQ